MATQERSYKVKTQSCKVIATMLFDYEDVVHTEIMAKGTIIKKDSYCKTLQNFF